jgi:TIR domain
MSDFFVSYAGPDRAWAEWIAWQVERAGYRSIVQAWDFVPGSNFVERMQQAVVEAERTIAVLSPAYVKSVYGTAEWLAVWRDDPQGERRALVPVRVVECHPPGLLGSIVYIDLVGLGESNARGRLLDGLADAASGDARRAIPPVFPAAADSPAPPFPGQLADRQEDDRVTDDLAERVAELCALRKPGAQVSRRTGAEEGTPHLDVSWLDQGLPVRWPIGVFSGGLDLTSLESFVERVHRP